MESKEYGNHLLEQKEVILVINQRNQKIGILRAIKDFFIGVIDFKGYTTIQGFWKVAVIAGITIIGLTYNLIYSITELNRRFFINYNFHDKFLEYGFLDNKQIQNYIIENMGVFFWISIIMIAILTICLFSSMIRRLNDIGLKYNGIIFLLGSYVIFMLVPLLNWFAIIFKIIILFVLCLETDYLIKRFSNTVFIEQFLRKE